MNHETCIQQLDEHSWMISEGTGKGRTHCYLLEGTETAVLIDTGLGTCDMRRITDELTAKNVSVINTHAHLDHISADNCYDVVYLHPKDRELYKEHCRDEVRTAFFLERYRKHGYDEEQLQKMLKTKEALQMCHIEENHNIHELYDDMMVDLGNRMLRIKETPGHTQGSICVLDEQRKWLFTGDTICELGVLLNFDHSTSVETYRQTLQKLYNDITFDYHMYAGHQRVPLDAAVIEDFIHCAVDIIEGSRCSDKTIHTYGRAVLTYRLNNIKEE